jgi:hypothetical protein
MQTSEYVERVGNTGRYLLTVTVNDNPGDKTGISAFLLMLDRQHWIQAGKTTANETPETFRRLSGSVLTTFDLSDVAVQAVQGFAGGLSLHGLGYDVASPKPLPASALRLGTVRHEVYTFLLAVATLAATSTDYREKCNSSELTPDERHWVPTDQADVLNCAAFKAVNQLLVNASQRVLGFNAY